MPKKKLKSSKPKTELKLSRKSRKSRKINDGCSPHDPKPLERTAGASLNRGGECSANWRALSKQLRLSATSSKSKKKEDGEDKRNEMSRDLPASKRESRKREPKSPSTTIGTQSSRDAGGDTTPHRGKKNRMRKGLPSSKKEIQKSKPPSTTLDTCGDTTPHRGKKNRTTTSLASSSSRDARKTGKSRDHEESLKQGPDLDSGMSERGRSLKQVQPSPSGGPTVGTKRSFHDSSVTAKKKVDVWFDDVDVEMVGGELVPKRRKTEAERTALVTGNDTSASKCVAIDCEMVGTGPGGDFSMLARCSIINHHGNVLYDQYVAPMDTISDFRTEYSGIRPRHLRDAPDFPSVQRAVSDIIEGRILVGHGLQHDLKALLLSHPKKDIRDTSRYKPFRKVSKGGVPSLKKLAKGILGITIQEGEHDSVEDARVAMKLYQLHKREWERSLKVREGQRERRQSQLRLRRKRKQRDSELQESSSHRRQTETQSGNTPFNIMLYSDA